MSHANSQKYHFFIDENFENQGTAANRSQKSPAPGQLWSQSSGINPHLEIAELLD